MARLTKREQVKGKKTERQWNELGYKVKPEEIKNGFGYFYWLYYSEEQVDSMTEEEKQTYKDKKKEERKRKREQEKKRLEAIERREREEAERREREWREREEKRLQELEVVKEQMAKGEYKVASVLLRYIVRNDYYMNDTYFENACYHYRVPVDTEIGKWGIFPFGDHIYYGTIEEFVDFEELKDCDWFPSKLRDVKEWTTEEVFLERYKNIIGEEVWEENKK